MNIPYNGREYVKFPLSGVGSDADMHVSFDRGETWHRLTMADGKTAAALVAGPGATENPENTVVLRPGTNWALVRLRSMPEDVIRPAGLVYVSS